MFSQNFAELIASNIAGDAQTNSRRTAIPWEGLEASPRLLFSEMAPRHQRQWHMAPIIPDPRKKYPVLLILEKLHSFPNIQAYNKTDNIPRLFHRQITSPCASA